jgi:hypothetical protein
MSIWRGSVRPRTENLAVGNNAKRIQCEGGGQLTCLTIAFLRFTLSCTTEWGRVAMCEANTARPLMEPPKSDPDRFWRIPEICAAGDAL